VSFVGARDVGSCAVRCSERCTCFKRALQRRALSLMQHLLMLDCKTALLTTSMQCLIYTVYTALLLQAGASVVFVDIGGNRQVETLVMLIPLLQSLLKPEVITPMLYCCANTPIRTTLHLCVQVRYVMSCVYVCMCACVRRLVCAHARGVPHCANRILLFATLSSTAQ
jgi:hypothetical protein